MRSMADLTPEANPNVVGIVYSYSDRRNGWYCYAEDAEGNQIGPAEYRYAKRDVLDYARETAKLFKVEVRRA